ncbi:metallophosphoesterase family protein [Paenibacillus sp. Marseille-Q4541]|uniref:metallophosphoesterase family protein n=1 Tax=Paenibacillus sp. Marseille-Q4541 TaxID=2831522 RepID=UPI001BAB3CC4|nr:metallophosphoesterase family protein [Paenibacillus sp. Marseille-Q4541]
MRFAIIADIHGKTDHLNRVFHDILNFSVDECICLGDVFEVKVSKNEAKNMSINSIDEIIDFDSSLLNFIANVRTVLGNQEERMLELYSTDMEESLYSLLKELPHEIELNDKALIVHGHQFEWLNFDEEYNHPIVPVWKRPLIFYGHNHQNAIFKIGKETNHNKYDRIEMKPGDKITFDMGNRYLINVGDIKNSPPNWVLYDDESNQVTFYTVLED